MSLGILSFGFLTLAPLLAIGLKGTRQARDNRTTAEIARTLIEEAKQGTLSAGTVTLDLEGKACAAPQAAYTAQITSTSETSGPGGAPGLTRLTLRVIPVGAPDRARTYAVVYPAGL